MIIMRREKNPTRYGQITLPALSNTTMEITLLGMLTLLGGMVYALYTLNKSLKGAMKPLRT